MRSSGNKHLAARGADTAQWIPIGGRGSAATGALRAEFRFVEIGLLDADVFPVDIEFIGDEHGEVRLDALADFGILAHDGHDAIGSDAQKCRGFESGGRRLQRLSKDFSDRIEMESDENSSSGDSGYAEKTAAIEECGLHRTSLLCALVACKICCGRAGYQHSRYCNAIRADLVSPSTRERNWGMGLAIPYG